MITKMEALGASRSVVGLVVPTGYSFNLDGTNIYMTLARLFLAQATNAHLTFGQEATVLAVAMLTSKGASGVTGAVSSPLLRPCRSSLTFRLRRLPSLSASTNL